MFINIVRCDLNNGILKKWKFYLFTGAFFSILAIFAYFDFDAALRMTPSPITADITVGDYLCFLFGGTSAGNLPIELIDKNNIVNSMFKFSFPSIWILIYLILLLLTLEYPYEDLMGFGKNIIIIANLFAFFIKEPPCKNCKPTHLPNFVHWNHSFLKLTKRSISYSISIACVCIFVNIFCVFLTIFFNIVKNNNAYLS